MAKFITMKINIGKIVKPQGIKGEVKLACYLDSASMLDGVKEFYIGTNLYHVEYARADSSFCYLKLAEVNDRNSAEALRNWDVFVEKTAISLPDGRFFVEDLIGCGVFLRSGKHVGTVTDVLQYGAADVFVCSAASGTVSFPFLKDCVLVDIEKKRITVDDERFGQVAVYEN